MSRGSRIAIGGALPEAEIALRASWVGRASSTSRGSKRLVTAHTLPPFPVGPEGIRMSDVRTTMPSA